MRETISVQGAKEHNLKNINIEIPRNQFVVVTGVSGSGKSSLAFDTVYAEGQRRYLESMSTALDNGWSASDRSSTSRGARSSSPRPGRGGWTA